MFSGAKVDLSEDVASKFNDPASLRTLQNVKQELERQLKNADLQLQNNTKTQLDEMHYAANLIKKCKNRMFRVKDRLRNLQIKSQSDAYTTTIPTDSASSVKSKSEYTSFDSTDTESHPELNKKKKRGLNEKFEKKTSLENIDKLKNCRANIKNVLSQLETYYALPKLITQLQLDFETYKSVDLFLVFNQWLRLRIWKDQIMSKFQMDFNQSGNQNGQNSNLAEATMDDAKNKLFTVLTKHFADLDILGFQLEEEVRKTLESFIGLSLFEPQKVVAAIRCVEVAEKQFAIERKRSVNSGQTIEHVLNRYPLGKKRRDAIVYLSTAISKQVEANLKFSSNTAGELKLQDILFKASSLVAELNSVHKDITKVFPSYYDITSLYRKDFERVLLHILQKFGKENSLTPEETLDLAAFLSHYIDLTRSFDNLRGGKEADNFAQATANNETRERVRSGESLGTSDSFKENSGIGSNQNDKESISILKGEHVDTLDILEKGDLQAFTLDMRVDDIYINNFVELCKLLISNYIYNAGPRVELYMTRLFNTNSAKRNTTSAAPDAGDSENSNASFAALNINSSIPEDFFNILSQEIRVINAKQIGAEFCVPFINRVCFDNINVFVIKHLEHLENELNNLRRMGKTAKGAISGIANTAQKTQAPLGTRKYMTMTTNLNLFSRYKYRKQEKRSATGSDDENILQLDEYQVELIESRIKHICLFINDNEKLYDLCDTIFRQDIEQLINANGANTEKSPNSTLTASVFEKLENVTILGFINSISIGINKVVNELFHLLSPILDNLFKNKWMENHDKVILTVCATLDDYFGDSGFRSYLFNEATLGKVIALSLDKLLETYLKNLFAVNTPIKDVRQCAYQMNKDYERIKRCFNHYLPLMKYGKIFNFEAFNARINAIHVASQFFETEGHDDNSLEEYLKRFITEFGVYANFTMERIVFLHHNISRDIKPKLQSLVNNAVLPGQIGVPRFNLEWLRVENESLIWDDADSLVAAAKEIHSTSTGHFFRSKPKAKTLIIT